MSEYRGSEWRKWDLHIHSKYSSEDRAKMDIQTIFEKAINAGLSVISITDHSNFDGLDEIWEHWDTGEINLDGSIFKISDKIEFLPGIELKASSGKRGIHFIAIFPKEIVTKRASKDFLKSDFLSKIDCSQTDIEKAGGGEYHKGLFEISVDFESTCKKVHELGGLIIVHAGYDKDHSIEKEVAHHADYASADEILNSLGPLKEKFMEECIDICELTNWSEKSMRQRDFYLTTFNKPTVVFSDSHEQISGDKFTWIKADKSIEGLRQIMFEPKNRITLGENKPFDPPIWLRKTILSFPSETHLDSEKFCYSGSYELFFSPNFTCLIGGRGTGKSMIINLLQEKFFPKSNDFFKARNLNDSAANQRLAIDSYIDAGNEVDASHIEFITQNEIQQLADDYLLFTNSIYSRIKKFDSDSELDKLEKQIFEHDTLLTDRNKNLVKVIEKLKLLDEKKKELSTQQGIVDSFQNPVYDELANNIKIISEWLTNIKEAQRQYLDLIALLRESIESYISKVNNNTYNKAIIEIVSRVKTALDSESTRDFSEIIGQILQKESELVTVNQKLSEYLISRGVSQENLNDVSNANSKIVSLGQEIKALSAEIIEIQKTLQSFSIQITNDIKDKYIAAVDKKAQEINIQLASINSPYLKTISLKYEFDISQAKNSIFEEFKDIFSKHLIGLGAKEPSLFELLFSVEPSLTIERQTLLDAVTQLSSMSKAKQWLIDLFTDENNFLIYQTIVLRHLFNAFSYKTIRVLYDGRRIEDSSFGQRCTATLVILLQLGNNPIVIDEPEAHLDSLLISNYLVELIKEKKKNRQIIFATHNANFVINGDADLIHILDMTDEKITSIRSTSIENKMNRKSLIGLEGGKEAFLSREKKYFINEIL